MINKKLHEKYPEPASLVKQIVLLNKRDYASEKDVLSAVSKVISGNPKAVKDYQSGKGQVIGYLIGMVQKELKGKGDPARIEAELIKKLQT
jgi:aspartyl-tRNA(Asn)/glutamyl-tRNA(Gln) amidotransferase subunit B